MPPRFIAPLGFAAGLNPVDKTILARYYALSSMERAMGTQPHFRPSSLPRPFGFAMRHSMQRTAAAYPDSFVYENGGLRVLRPVSFFVTDLPAIHPVANPNPIENETR